MSPRFLLPVVVAAISCSPATSDQQPTAARSSAVSVGSELAVAPTLAGSPLTGVGVRVVWTGTHYAVFTAYGRSIVATRVDTAGNAVDVPVRKIVELGSLVLNFDVAMGSSSMLVAATDNRSSSAVRTVVVAPDLTPSPPNDHLKGPCGDVAAAALGTRFLVACNTDGGRQLTAARIGNDNVALDTLPLELTDLSSSTVRWPQIAADGTRWMVSWTEGMTSSLQLGSAVVGADGVIARRGPLPWTPDTHYASSTWDPAAAEYRVAIDGALVRLSREGLFLGSAPAPRASISFWRTGTVVHATWPSGFELRDTTVAPNGSLVSTEGAVIATSWSSSGIAVAASPTQALVASGASALRMSTVPVAIDLTPRTVLFASRQQSIVGHEFDGAHFNVLFRESPGNQLRAVRLAPAASGVDAPFDLFTDESVAETVVAFDGTAHVLARGGSAGARLERRLSLDKSPATTTTIGVGPTQPWGIASSGGVTLVGTCAGASGPCGVTRIDAAGAKLDPTPIPVVAKGAIAGVGGKFIVVYEDLDGVKWYRVSASGVVEDAPPRILTAGAGVPSVTSDGARAIVAHRFSTELIVRAISPDGTTTSATLVANAYEPPIAASDGRRTLVAWRGPGDGTTFSIVGKVLGPDLTPLQSAPFTIVPAARFLSGVASAPGGHFLVAVGQQDHTLSFRLGLVPVTAGSLPGDMCTAGTECETGACVDGVCCDTACSGQCEACDVPGSIGKCQAVLGTPRGMRIACAAPAGECANRCDGVRRKECSFASAADVCSRLACEGGIETHASNCDGAGACLDVPRPCGAFGCGPTACHTACTADGDCAAGHRCESGGCVPRTPLAMACSSDAQCASGFCTDGVCCDARCDGVCEACDVSGSAGRCSAVHGSPRGGRPACLVAPSNPCSQSVCDGTARRMCNAFVGAEVTCRAATCSSGTSIAEAHCDGSGACPTPSSASCPGGTCADDQTCSAAPETGGGCGCSTPSRAPADSFAWMCGAVALALASVRGRQRKPNVPGPDRPATLG